MSRHREQLPGRLACITFAESPLLHAFQGELSLGIRLYGDPSRAVYRAFGFGRGSVRRIWLDPRVWIRYAELLARGQRPGRSGQDTLQLGGDAVLDQNGRLHWIHRSAGPDDRPSVELIGAELRAATTRT
jgi:hypothetical protein